MTFEWCQDTTECWCWGSNGDDDEGSMGEGRLGDGTNENRNSPVRPRSMVKAKTYHGTIDGWL